MNAEFNEILKNGQFVGIVEDNADPDKKQRIRIRIPYFHGEASDVPTTSLPWAQPKRDLNGLSFEVPDIGKVVNVFFPTGNIYMPIYDAALHLNVNLQKKVETLDGDEYTQFVALLYNHNTQIYVETAKGLSIVHKFQRIDMTENDISLNLKDNQSTLFLGDSHGNQESVLGTHFMAWMDTFTQTLLNAYIGNLGAPCIANPQLIQVIAQYNSLRQTFLSKHVFVTDNDMVRSKDFDVTAQIGDKVERTNRDRELAVSVQPINYHPAPQTQPAGAQDTHDYVAPPNNGLPDTTTQANDNPPPETTGNEYIDKLSGYMKSQNFTVYDAAYRLNIVGIRRAIKDSGTITNIFDDTVAVFWKDDRGEWNLRKYMCTTTPGYKPRTKTLPEKHGGVAMMVYGQYKDQYKLGFHAGRTGKPGGAINDRTGQLYPEHRALVNSTVGFVRHQPLTDRYLTPQEQRDHIQRGAIGTNIHRNSEGAPSPTVDNWSEGCQVFKFKKEHDEFISLCQQQQEKTHVGSFTYTLIPEKELNEFES